MAELKLLYESSGFENVRTYLQSGNVIFETKLSDKKKISGIIEKGIYKKYGFKVSVLIKTTDDLKKILKNNPFLKSKNTDADKYYITMLFNTPEKTLMEELNVLISGNDEFEVLGDVIYINCPEGYGRTKFSNNIFEKKLKVIATTRNWRTINNLSEL
jgi:uncharacterized protein (DUF1697 family)